MKVQQCMCVHVHMYICASALPTPHLLLRGLPNSFQIISFTTRASCLYGLSGMTSIRCCHVLGCTGNAPD